MSYNQILHGIFTPFADMNTWLIQFQ